MSDKDPDVTEENADGDGQTPPSEKKPETDSDLREEVDQKLEGIFGDLEDDGHDVSQTPPHWTDSDLREEVDQKLEGIFGDLDDDEENEAGDVVDGNDAASAPAEQESVSDSNAAVSQAVDDDSGDLDNDNEGPGIDEAGEAPAAPTEAVTPSGPPATGDKPEDDAVVSTPPERDDPQAAPAGIGETDQFNAEMIEDDSSEVIADIADGDGGEEEPAPEEEQQTVSDNDDEVNQAVDDEPGEIDNRNAGDGLDGAVNVQEPLSAPAEAVESQSEDPSFPVDTPAALPEAQKARKPYTARIIVWGLVLIIITATVRYLATYEFEEAATTPAGQADQLFHKVGPMSSPAAVRTPGEHKALQPTAAVPDKAAKPQKAAEQPRKAGPTVKAYVPRTYPYAIHMDSFRSAEVAKGEVTRYRRGFQAFLVRVDLGERGIWYRIFFGHFSTATSTLEAIEKYNLTGAFVSRTRYACLIGTYPSAAQAAAASRQLSDKDFFPYTVFINNGYHVFVGAHPTLAAAQALLMDLSVKGFSSDLIER